MDQQALNKKQALTHAKNSVTLIHGVFDSKFFDGLKEQNFSEIFLTEGRPTLEAAQNSCEELLKRKITPTLISDNMAGFLFFKELVKEVWMAYQMADKEAALCDIGALILGVLAKKHNVPVYLFPAARKTRFLSPEKDLLEFQKHPVAPKGVRGYAPLVEWLPRKYITEIYS